jgi:hypothetical protein
MSGLSRLGFEWWNDGLGRSPSVSGESGFEGDEVLSRLRPEPAGIASAVERGDKIVVLVSRWP